MPLQNSKITKQKKKKDIFLYRSVCLVSAKMLEIDWYGQFLNQYKTLEFEYRCSYRYGVLFLAPHPPPPTPQELYTYRVSITSMVRSGKSESVNGINLCHFFRKYLYYCVWLLSFFFVLFISIFFEQNWTYN